MKNKKNNLLVKILAAAMAVSMLLTLSACSASSAKEDSYYETESYEPSYDMMMDYDYGFDNGMSVNTSASGAEAPSEPMTEEAGGSEEAEIERKIIKNADINMDAENAEECYASILDYAKQLGGYESSCSTNTNDYGDSRYIYIHAELRLPPEKLEDFVGKVGEYGTVTSLDVSSDEITEEYYDLETRMKSKQAALESYYALLEKAETVDEILVIQTRIDGITEEIEAIKGRLRVYDALVSESKVILRISEYVVDAPAEKEFEWDSLSGSDVGKLVKNGFLSVCNFVWSLLQWLFIIIISASPLLLIAGIVLLVVRFVKKRNEANGKAEKRAAEKAAKNAAKASALPTAPNYSAQNDIGDNVKK